MDVGMAQHLLAQDDQLGPEPVFATLRALGDEALALEGREKAVDGALVEVDLAADLGDAHLRSVIAERLEHGDGAAHRLVPRHDALAALAPLPDALCRRILSHGTLSFPSSEAGPRRLYV